MYNIYVEKSPEYLRVVEMDSSNKITRCYIDENSQQPSVGSIYLGRIENEAKLMGGCYVDIGTDKSCYMPNNKAHKAFKHGDNVLVEILKEQTGNKGAVCTSKVTLGGNFLVIGRGCGRKMFSKKIRSREFRDGYKNFAVEKNLDLVFRKNSEKAPREAVIMEYNRLVEEFKGILSKEKYSLNVGLMHEGKGIIGEVLSQLNHGEKYYITVNHESIKDKIETILESFPEDTKKNISVVVDNCRTLFCKFNLESQIIKFRNRRTLLPSGAEIVVDRKEALTVIDVNSSCYDYSKNYESVNLQCAELIPQIIISRNLSGIIVVDFINTEGLKEKERIVNTVKNGFVMDRNKVVIKEFDDLSLLHITRERRGKSVYEHLDYKIENKICDVNLVKPEYMMFLVKNRLLHESYENNHNVTVEIPSIYNSCFPDFTNSITQYMNERGYKILVEYKNDIEEFKIRKNIQRKA